MNIDWIEILLTRAFLAVGLLLVGMSAAGAQGLTRPSSTESAPIVGGVGVRPPAIGPAVTGSENQARRHLDPMGKPCVVVNGISRPLTTNPKVFNHVIVATNGCGQVIKLQVCYYKSQSCMPVQLAGYSRKEAVLGVFPSLKDFRYEYREQF
jgi:hypothetical protein